MFSDCCTVYQTPATGLGFGLNSADQALRAPHARPLPSLEEDTPSPEKCQLSPIVLLSYWMRQIAPDGRPHSMLKKALPQPISNQHSQADRTRLAILGSQAPRGCGSNEIACEPAHSSTQHLGPLLQPGAGMQPTKTTQVPP